MRVYIKFLTLAALILNGISLITAQEIAKVSTTETLPALSTSSGDDKNKKKEEATTEIKDPLVVLLVKKGLLDEAEAKSISVGSPVEQRDRLANLLLQKGIISVAELDAIRVVQPTQADIQNTQAVVKTSSTVSNEKTAMSSTTAVNSNAVSATAQTAPAVIPAITPLRVLQLEGTKRDGLIPDIKLGSGAKVKLYGFFKVSALSDTSNPSGNDFPLPGFLNDSGPNGSPQFHLKARGFRFGANFEWLDPAPDTTITGKVELDFEGDFPRVTNRNIGTIRASQPSIRLAWVRIDRMLNDKTSAHVLFGQDWTPFASSTLPNTIETTGLHLGYGNIYERLPQIRTGVNFLLSKNRNVRFQPEFAIALSASGSTPSNVADQLGFGERQGPDANMPEFQGRFVLQFQADKAAGVAPAQLIGSWMYGKRRAILRRQDVPTAFQGAFPNGAEVESSRYGYTAEFQIPTRFATVIGKYYHGADLRFYFGGQLFSNYNDTFGLTGVTTATSIDGASTVAFGFDPNGNAVIADQNAVRGQGGFIEVGIPLSRIFNADPKGRMAGFTANLHYGYDEANPNDIRRILGATLNPAGQPANLAGANRGKSDAAFYNLQYKFNSFVTFAFEQTYFRTRAVNNAGNLPLFRGIPSRTTQNIRSEFATIFTF